jgi:hypothetical protein
MSNGKASSENGPQPEDPGDNLGSSMTSCWICLQPIFVGSLVQTCYLTEPEHQILVAHSRCAHERALIAHDFTTGKRHRYPH